MAASPMAPTVSTVECSTSWNRSIATRESSSLTTKQKSKFTHSIHQGLKITLVRLFWRYNVVRLTSAIIRGFFLVSWCGFVVEVQYLTGITLFISFLDRRKVFAPSEPSLKSEKRNKTIKTSKKRHLFIVFYQHVNRKLSDFIIISVTTCIDNGLGYSL